MARKPGKRKIIKSNDTTAGGNAPYEAPKLTILGTLTELTKQGTAPPDELLNDGSQP